MDTCDDKRMYYPSLDDYDDTRVYWTTLDGLPPWAAYAQRDDILDPFLRRVCKGVLVDVILYPNYEPKEDCVFISVYTRDKGFLFGCLRPNDIRCFTLEEADRVAGEINVKLAELELKGKLDG